MVGRSRYSGGFFGSGTRPRPSPAWPARRNPDWRNPPAFFTASRALSTSGFGRGPRRQAAGTHDVEAPEHVGMLHADTCRAVASHGVANQAAAGSLGNRAVMSVDICDNIVRDEALKVSGRNRTRIHGAVVQRFSNRAARRSFLSLPARKRLQWSVAHGSRGDHCSAPMEYPWSAYTTG